MKTLKFGQSKIWYWILFTILSTSILSCTKEELSGSTFSSTEQLQSRLKPNEIIKWLNGNINSNTTYKNKTINHILQNLQFDKMYAETLHDGENLVIVPLKAEYFSQHVNSSNPHPLQYLLLVEDTKSEIRRSDIVLFNSADITLKTLPKNAFHDFFNEESFPVDGTFTLITLGDVKEFEMDFKNSKKSAFRLWKAEKSLTQREGLLQCSEWYLVTTTYYEDGHTEVDWEYLGTTCSSCVPNELCDHFDDTPGGIGGQEGTPVARQVSYIVKSELTSYEDWDITGTFNLQGIKFANVANNVFTGIVYVGSVHANHNSAVTANPLSPRYIIYTETSHSSGLISTTTASGTISANLKYPHWPGGAIEKNYSVPHIWQASIELF